MASIKQTLRDAKIPELTTRQRAQRAELNLSFLSAVLLPRKDADSEHGEQKPIDRFGNHPLFDTRVLMEVASFVGSDDRIRSARNEDFTEHKGEEYDRVYDICSVGLFGDFCFLTYGWLHFIDKNLKPIHKQRCPFDALQPRLLFNPHRSQLYQSDMTAIAVYEQKEAPHWDCVRHIHLPFFDGSHSLCMALVSPSLLLVQHMHVAYIIDLDSKTMTRTKTDGHVLVGASGWAIEAGYSGTTAKWRLHTPIQSPMHNNWKRWYTFSSDGCDLYSATIYKRGRPASACPELHFWCVHVVHHSLENNTEHSRVFVFRASKYDSWEWLCRAFVVTPGRITILIQIATDDYNRISSRVLQFRLAGD